MHHDIVFNY